VFFRSEAMKIDFEKMRGLAPAIVQDAITETSDAGFMNQPALEKPCRADT